MDKNAIKKYAVWARRELISRVSQKAAFYGITDTDHGTVGAESVDERVLTAAEKKQRDALIHQIQKDGYEQTIEEVAYTWFNRFSALRYMEVNGYLPTHVRVFTDDAGALKPQILTEAINLELDGLDMQKVYDLKNSNQDEALYRYLLITQCNALNAILPGMFQKIEDYTELLLPDNLLREGSVIEQMVTTIPEEDWTDQVQIIGWMYQYYNAEKKDDVFAALKKNVKITKENIPAATQLFTPDWIVRYMVENSLGRLWLEGHPDVKNQLLPTEEEQSAYAAGNRDPEDTKWHYYLEEAEQEPEVRAQLAEIRKEYAALTPDQLKVIDPCMGSGHILVYMFDVLVKIYESYGYTTRDAVSSIVENNLYGLDIDDRAAQLAYFAVMMKARQYDRRFFSRGIQPHVYAIAESNHLDKFAVEYFCNGDEKLTAAMDTIITELHDAKEYGSILNVTPQDWSVLYARFAEIKEDIHISREAALRELLPLVQAAEALAQKYDVVVTNPPYMGSAGMNDTLISYVKQFYPDAKSDMSTVMMEKTIGMLTNYGYMSMINIPVWMFITSYEKLRIKIISYNTIINMIHPGRGIFGSDFGTTAFVIGHEKISNYAGNYHKLFKKQGDVESTETREQYFLNGIGKYISEQERYMKIPSATIAYWVSENFIKAFGHKNVADFGFAGIGMRTGDNNRFLRLWYEVANSNTLFGCTSVEEQIESMKKWIPYNKGGEFRRWYGNNDYVVNWYNNGYEIKENTRRVYPQLGDDLGWKISNEQYYFKKGITWSGVTISKCSFRVYEEGYIFDSGANGYFLYDDNNRYYLAACLNNAITLYVMEIINPTVNNGSGTIRKIPIIIDKRLKPDIDKLAKENIYISKHDWDSFETSWDFQHHPLIRKVPTIAEAFDQWQAECEERFNQLKANEEELNRIFIDIYGLQDELTPEVEDKDVTVRKADLGRDIRSFISYAVGCMFGRYSLDVEGLAYAGGNYDSKYCRWIRQFGDKATEEIDENGNLIHGGWAGCTLWKYDGVRKDGKWIPASFAPDTDNIIPICDDEYFDDDIVGRFVEFVKTVYGEDTLNENLKFIADALGGKGAPKEVIRNYFLNDFYADHCKIYQKRPIYWLFDSGKKNGFKALIYMHRYREDTIARIRTDYVHEQQGRYRTAIADLESRIANADTGSRVKLTKQLTKLQNQAEELRVYEEKIHHLADQMIRIDLDDGVNHNYEIFKDVLAKIK